MKKAKKRVNLVISAYELGGGSAMEVDLLAAGTIKLQPDGRYELFSRESVNGSGQIAMKGDFFKIDSGGFPYPNDREFFLANHKHIGGNQYEQISKPLEAWTVDDGMCPEIDYLIRHKGLVIDEADPDRYFSAPLWGTVESAGRDAVIIFYEIQRDDSGRITDVSFNFVHRGEFDKTYEWVN